MKSDSISNGPKFVRMLSWLFVLLTFNLSFLTIHSCGFDVEDPTPPSPPVWVQKSFPEHWPERGIDAHEIRGVSLEWEHNRDEGTVAYLIYRAEHFADYDSLGDFLLLSRLEIEPNSELEYIDTDLVEGIRYFYKLKAEDMAKNQSEFSETVGYLLLQQISIHHMSPNGISKILGSHRSLSWIYAYGIAMENYCLTLLDQNNDFILRSIFTPVSYTNHTESWYIPDSIALDSNEIYKWRIDTDGQYLYGLETAGSESPWATFLYVGE